MQLDYQKDKWVLEFKTKDPTKNPLIGGKVQMIPIQS